MFPPDGQHPLAFTETSRKGGDPGPREVLAVIVALPLLAVFAVLLLTLLAAVATLAVDFLRLIWSFNVWSSVAVGTLLASAIALAAFWLKVHDLFVYAIVETAVGVAVCWYNILPLYVPGSDPEAKEAAWFAATAAVYFIVRGLSNLRDSAKDVKPRRRKLTHDLVRVTYRIMRLIDKNVPIPDVWDGQNAAKSRSPG